MIKILALLASLTLSYTHTYAQDYAFAEHRAKCHTRWMTKELDLTKEQASNVQSVNVVFSKKLEDLKAPASNISQLMAAAKSLDLEKDKSLEPLMSSEQFFQYQTMKIKGPALVKECLTSEPEEVLLLAGNSSKPVE